MTILHSAMIAEILLGLTLNTTQSINQNYQNYICRRYNVI
jgi:hypothetical protein